MLDTYIDEVGGSAAAPAKPADKVEAPKPAEKAAPAEPAAAPAPKAEALIAAPAPAKPDEKKADAAAKPAEKAASTAAAKPDEKKDAKPAGDKCGGEAKNPFVAKLEEKKFKDLDSFMVSATMEVNKPSDCDAAICTNVKTEALKSLADALKAKAEHH